MIPNSDPTFPTFPIFTGLGFFLCLIPLPWHLQAWNAGTCMYMIWTALACLNLFINSIVWHNNVLNPAPVWCDISSRFIVGVSVAIPAASLCINRRLYKIAIAQDTTITYAKRRRAIVEDLLIGIGIPVIEMALEFIVSGHRFNILEGVGCYPAVVNVWLSYVLTASWPLAIGLVSAIYCILTLRAFYKRSADIKAMMGANSSLTLHRYFRLMALATTELICTTPLAAYSIYLNATSEPIVPYRGWADLHFNYSRVEQIPAIFWHSDHGAYISIELSRWSVVICALVFFAFFGFAEEARRHYKSAFSAIVPVFKFRRASPPLPRFTIETAKFQSTDGLLPVLLSQATPNSQQFSFNSPTDSLPSPFYSYDHTHDLKKV